MKRPTLLIVILSCIYFYIKPIQVSKAPPLDEFHKIVLSPSMVINETALGEASLLVDEQELSGDPMKGLGGKPSNYWFPGWLPDDFGGVSAVIDLQKTHEISCICLFGTRAKGTISVYAGEPFQWKFVLSDSIINYQKWNQHPVKIQTRYLRVCCNSRNLSAEMLVYGKPSNNTKSPNTIHTHKTISQNYPTIEQLVGLNTFIDDPISKTSIVKWLREYHDWEWNDGDRNKKYPDNKYQWAPSYPSWDFDSYYQTMSNNNINVVPCIQNCQPWRYGKVQNKPVDKKQNPTAPESYEAHAHFMYHFAARYGSTKIPNYKSHNANNQSLKTGLGYIKYIENYNEPDKMWLGRDARFHPYEYVAMTSADYDGHQTKIGTNIGVKNADPNIKMVMAGLSSIDTNYLKAIHFWTTHNRAGIAPFDILNIHHYCQDNKKTTGISPEQDSLTQRIKGLINFRNRYYPNMPVWITEFGYDTHQGSIQKAPSNKHYTAEEIQAIWLLRSYFLLSSTGIDKAAMYMLRDVDGSNPTQYSSSGITLSKEKLHNPKLSWWYLKQLVEVLGKYRFESQIMSNNSSVYIYQYRHSISGKKALVIWNSSTEQKESNFKIKLSKPLQECMQSNFTSHQNSNEKIKLRSDERGYLYLDVSEKPLILELIN